mgnify:CR=1 FL=1
MISPSEIKVGIVAEQGLDIWSALTCLKQSGCTDENIIVKYVPSFQLALGALFFAEYTDVDCTVVIGREHSDPMATALINLQIQWNMVVEIGGAECAEHIVDMISLQNEMESNAVMVKPRRNFS